MLNALLMTTPATGLSAYAVAAQSCTAPNAPQHGTGLPFAGSSAAAQAAVAGVLATDVPVRPPRGAPV